MMEVSSDRPRVDADSPVQLMSSTQEPIHIAFLGCGFITRVHSRHIRRLGGLIVPAYASRDRATADAYRTRFGGSRSYGDYASAIEDPRVHAIVIAVPPRFHRDLTLQALAAGKHVLVEKPAFPRMGDYLAVRDARDRAGRVVLVGENDHYKPLAVCLRRLLAAGAIGEMVFAHFTTLARRLKTADDWRNDETMAGGDAFFEEGIHWLHLAGSLGPTITSVTGYRPAVVARGSRPPREEHARRLPVRQRRRRRPLLLARGAVAAERPAAVEAVRPSRASSPSSRTAPSCSCAAAACRGCCCPGSATRAATRRCTAISRVPSGWAVPPR